MRLIRSKDAFCLHGNVNQATNKVSMKEVSLFVRKIKPNPFVQLAHTKALQHGIAKYPFLYDVYNQKLLQFHEAI